MIRVQALVYIFSVFAAALFSAFPPAANAAGVQVSVRDRSDKSVSKITDGNLIRLRLDLAEPASQPETVHFSLDASDTEIASCAVQQGGRFCESEPFYSLGWRWLDGAPTEIRTVAASAEGGEALGSASIQVAARPVVMVHGFSSSWIAWERYLGPQGYLASIGVPGFAAGDGQVPGVMNTGAFTNPAGRTNTIAQNAAILGEYIGEVKQATGAEVVDLLAHSMGGMISRYYIDRVMQDRDIAQLMMLGSPSAGTDCANLPASLGFYLPATLEIRPSYAYEIFNRQITHRKGVAFYALAGVPIIEPFGSPCADVPSDIVISKESVSTIPLHLSETSLLHVDLNTSRQAFDEFVRPLLQKGPGQFPDEPDPAVQDTPLPALQFTRVFTGHVDAGSTQELTIHIDPNITVASFALYDPTRSLQVEVRGASGNVINLDPVKNGLIVVEDPQSLLYLGYGFANPKPGAWKVTLGAGGKTPESGADYALTARFVGGAVMHAAASSLLPELGEAVEINAELELDGQLHPIERADALIRAPSGSLETVQLAANGSRYSASWTPSEPGLHAIDVRVSGTAPDGSPLERTAFLSLEAQPAENQPRTVAWLVGLAAAALGLILLGLFGVIWMAQRLRRRAGPRRDAPGRDAPGRDAPG